MAGWWECGFGIGRCEGEDSSCGYGVGVGVEFTDWCYLFLLAFCGYSAWEWGKRTFPGMLTVPPMTTTSFARRNVSGSIADARARLVNGPTATMVTVSGSFSRSTRSISSCAGRLDGTYERGVAAVPF